MRKSLAESRILVVEDESLILFLIEDILADAGCKSISAAANIAQAKRLIETNVFDAAMLDVNLNGYSSDAIADALIAAGVPFVFCTGNSIRETDGPFADRPMLRKPFTDVQLIQMLESLLAGAKESETRPK